VCDLNIEKLDWNDHLDSDEHRINIFKQFPVDYSGEDYKQELNTDFIIFETNSKYNNKFKTWQIDYNLSR
jgi:hypothetical protein